MILIGVFFVVGSPGLHWANVNYVLSHGWLILKTVATFVQKAGHCLLPGGFLLRL